MRRAFRIPFARTPRRQLAREVDDELAFHIDSRVEKLVAQGWDPDAARREALRQFGNVESIRDDCVELDVQRERGAWWTEIFAELRQDVHYALHSLRRAPGWTTVAVLTLALGVGANTAVFTVVNGVLLRPLPYRDAGRLMLLSDCEPKSFGCDPAAMIDAHYLAFEEQNRSFEGVAMFHDNEVNLTGTGDAVRLSKGTVTPGFFSVMGVDLQLGRGFTAEEGKGGGARVVVISDRLWRGRFGADGNILGRSLHLDDDPYTIVGVTPPGFDFPSGQDIWVPIEVVHREPFTVTMPVVGRLREGVPLTQASAELATIVHSVPLPAQMRERGTKESDVRTRILPLREMFVQDAERSLIVFSATVAFVLLIACVNVANLMLMRTASRTQEMAVRRTLGAGRSRLIRQLLTESTVLALAGTTVGIVLAVVGERALLALAPAGTIPLADNIRVDARVLGVTLGVALVSGIALGLVPALRATRRPLRESLSHGTRVASEGHFLLGALAVAEIALALVLLTGAGLLMRSFAKLQQVDLGFHPENVVSMKLELSRGRYDDATRMAAFRSSVLEELRGLPDSASVGVTNTQPLGDAVLGWSYTPQGESASRRAVIVGIGGDYFRSMGISVLAGRAFTSTDDASAPGVAVVSKTLARKVWPGESAVGKRIRIPDIPAPPAFLRGKTPSSDTSSTRIAGPDGERWLTVVGVVSDVLRRNLVDAAAPGVYLPFEQIYQTMSFNQASRALAANIEFTVRTSAEEATVERAMREIVRRVDGDQPIASITSMQDVVAGQREQPLFRTRLLGVFSLMAVLLAVVGIYGVLAYSVTERTREIGIRMAMGAESAQVMRMVVRRTLVLGVIGVAIGSAGALAATRVMAKFLFGVSPTDPLTFVATAALLTGVALLAGLVPAWRASIVDPVVALRHE
jgi:putative ABC transport system permease protein